MTDTTVLTSWAKAIRRALERAGVDSRALFEQAGLDPAALDDPDARYPLQKTVRLWALAVEATGDEAFGLTVASQVTPTTFHALGYSLTASSSLREAFERMLRYFRLVTDAAELEFGLVGDEYRFRIRPIAAATQPAPESMDAFASLFVRFCRAHLGREFAPLRVSLRRAPPRDVVGFERVFRCPLRFGADENELWFPREPFERRLDGANPELARHNDEIALRHLARVEKQNLRARVQSVLVAQLPLGEPSAEKVADALHLSLRSLQRRLAEEESSYEALLDEARRELACSYLKDRKLSVSEITFLLGFSHPGSFTRAFKRWTGVAPSQFRASH
jgi:AraC-like DNA-binding protein